jgi:transposase
MLTFPANVSIYLANSPTDLRKSFDGLATIVQAAFGMEPTNGDLYVFLNRRATQVRMLFWATDGFCIVAKRLEAGTFRRVRRAEEEQAHVEIDAAELAMLLEGIDVDTFKRRRRYVHPNRKSTTRTHNRSHSGSPTRSPML